MNIDSGEIDLIYFLVRPLPETANGIIYYISNCLAGALPYIYYTLRDTTIIPLVRSQVFFPGRK